MMDSPLFSIIVPIYNTPEEYLKACIDGIGGQTLKELEILLIDDGSGEKTAELCDACAQTDPRVRVIHQVNQGVSAARNRGIREARGQWIMFADADDWLERNACESLYRILKDSDCDMLLFNMTKEYPGRQEKLNYGLEDGTVYDMSRAEVREKLYRRAMLPPNTDQGRFCTIYYSCDKVFRRTFLQENGLAYPVGLPKSEDKVFILTCLEKLGKLHYVSLPLYHYRMNDQSVCHKYSDTADSDRRQLAKLLFEIASRMDRELAEKKQDPSYQQISRDCNRFIFGIISDVLNLKYYHPNNPNKKNRNRAARAFLEEEPFRTAIRDCSYSELPGEAKLKKLLLSCGMVSVFQGIYRVNRKLIGKG